jgi:hypothetical protein
VHVNHTGTGSERIHRRMTCQLVWRPSRAIYTEQSTKYLLFGEHVPAVFSMFRPSWDFSEVPNLIQEVQSSWNVMAHGDAQEGKWRGN